MNWDTTISDSSVIFSTYSTARDGGYPGSLNVAMKLTLSPVSGELKIEYTGMTTKKTPIDISNNIMMNLAGHKSGNIFMLLEQKFLLIKYTLL